MNEIILIGIVIWAIFSKSEGRLHSLRSRFSDKTPAEHLSYLVRYMRENGISPAQLSKAWDEMPQQAMPAVARRSTGEIASKVLFTLGALFVFAGVGVYTSMFWFSMSSFMRILITLGLGAALSVYAAVAIKEGKYPKAVLPLVLVAAAMECGGWFVFLHEMFPQGDDVRKASLFCFGIMALQQGLTYYSLRANSLAFTAIAFAYAAASMALDIAGMEVEHAALLLGGSLVFTAHSLTRTPHKALVPVLLLFGLAWFNAGLYGSTMLFMSDWGFAAYACAVAELATGASVMVSAVWAERVGYIRLSTLLHFMGAIILNTGIYEQVQLLASHPLAALVTGASIISFAHAMQKAEQDRLAGLAYFIGSAFMYCGLFDEVRHTPLELLYLGVAIAMMYVSAVLHSRAILFTTVLAILGFIGYYTNAYFLNQAGWPVALIIMGMAFLGVGSVAIRIKRNYLT